MICDSDYKRKRSFWVQTTSSKDINCINKVEISLMITMTDASISIPQLITISYFLETVISKRNLAIDQ